MTRKELLKNDVYWTAWLESALFNYDLGVLNREDMYEQLLVRKNELIKVLEDKK
jgi:hypothetical protein